MNLSMQEFIKFRNFICQRTGILFDEKKIYFVEKRIKKRLQETDCTDMIDYFRFLRFSDPNGVEFQKLINLLTTNETYFFREFDQLSCFAEYCLDEVKKQKPDFGLRTINIWCAACSSGEEAYTLAIILKEMLLAEEPDWKCKIIATDIDENILQKAERGVYDERSVKHVPQEYFDKYLTSTTSGFRVKSGLRDLVQFENLNFMNRPAMRKMRGFDFVFCRNVLIYFEDKARKEVVDHLFNALNPGGFIFLGHAESIGRITTKFRLRRLGKALTYQKPTE